VWPEV